MTRKRQERAPMSKRDKLFELEIDMKDVVHQLEGNDTDFTFFLSPMVHHGTLKMLADVFTHERRKFFRIRRLVEDAVFMLGQIAHRINSHLLPRIIDLHLDLSRLWQSEDPKCPSEEEARRIVREFEYCHDALLSEISFMDVRERVNIWPKAPVHPVDISDSYEVFRPDGSMMEEEATRESRATALRNHRREMRRIGFSKKTMALTACFSRLADEVQGGVASASSEHSPDWQMLSEILKTRTCINYEEFYDMDLYFCDDSELTNDYVDDTFFADEETKETYAKRKMGCEIVRYVDAAIALARSVKSESASGFVLAKSLFEKHKGSFSDADDHISVKADLADFIDKLKSAHEQLQADVAAAKLGGEQPVKVELTKKSGETIAKAVRPGRGGARRIFSEEVQEKCWRYWEAGRKNPDVAQIAETSGRKLRHEDVFKYFRRELAALEPPIDSPEAFRGALRARTNRISRKKSH